MCSCVVYFLSLDADYEFWTPLEPKQSLILARTEDQFRVESQRGPMLTLTSVRYSPCFVSAFQIAVLLVT